MKIRNSIEKILIIIQINNINRNSVELQPMKKNNLVLIEQKSNKKPN